MDRNALRAVFESALAAIDPSELVRKALAGRTFGSPRNVTVLAVGKAAAGMVDGVARVLGDDVTGVAVTAEPAQLPEGVAGHVGAHPVPDESSVLAGQALLDAAAAAPPEGTVICLISGGGSALAEVPVPTVAISSIAALTKQLLTAGASIEELNTVRVALSRFKGGGLAEAVRARSLITLAISDVAPAPPALIASGPTLAPSRPTASARDVLERFRLWDDASAAIRLATDSPAPPRPTIEQDFEVIADGATVARAAAAAVDAAGSTPLISDRVLEGEAREVAARIVYAGVAPGAVGIHWGETTVAVRGAGRGGRNHEAALAAGIEIAGSGAAFLAAGTDGVDGAAGGAGAVVDGSTMATAIALGLDPAAFLDNNDSGGFFDSVPGRIELGATGTNVADLWLYSSDGKRPK